MPLLNVLQKARHDFLNEFSKTRGDIEHEDFEIERFKLIRESTSAKLEEPNFQGSKLSARIDFYYNHILDLIEKLTVYFAGINCEERNNFYQLYVATNPDFPNLIYRYYYRIMGMPFVFETIKCDFN